MSCALSTAAGIAGYTCSSAELAGMLSKLSSQTQLEHEHTVYSYSNDEHQKLMRKTHTGTEAPEATDAIGELSHLFQLLHGYCVKLSLRLTTSGRVSTVYDQCCAVMESAISKSVEVTAARQLTFAHSAGGLCVCSYHSRRLYAGQCCVY